MTLVLGPTGRPAPIGVDVVPVHTADEMHDEVMARAGNADVIVKAAAVSDFKPQAHADHKLKKSAGPPDVDLVPTPDILKELGRGPLFAQAQRDPRRLRRRDRGQSG